MQLIQLTHGTLHPHRDQFCHNDVTKILWHRIMPSKFADYIGLFWVSRHVGANPYHAVMDDFGNLVELVDTPTSGRLVAPL